MGASSSVRSDCDKLVLRLALTGMDFSITAALIAGGTAAGVAVVGTITTAWTTARTLRSNRETTGEAGLWDKTSAVYEELLYLVNVKQLTREHEVRGFRFADQTEQAIEAQIASWERPEYPTIGHLVGAIRKELREGHLRSRRGLVRRLRSGKASKVLGPGQPSRS